MQFRAKKCFGMLRNVSFCCVHTCAPRDATWVGGRKRKLPTAETNLLQIAFPDIADRTECLEVLQNSLTAVCPSHNMINVQNDAWISRR
jgi:hypothetical protein